MSGSSFRTTFVSKSVPRSNDKDICVLDFIYVYPESPCVRLSQLPEDTFKLCSLIFLGPVFYGLTAVPSLLRTGLQ